MMVAVREKVETSRLSAFLMKEELLGYNTRRSYHPTMVLAQKSRQPSRSMDPSFERARRGKKERE
ncbi:MAG TPA: hypothetical protein P5224_05685 [Mesotoga sp.]|nr:hypothetical protein [Mesotoga sp.]